jgi:TP901 family phage tail tape measure protein
MSDNTARFVIELDGDDAAIRSIMSGFKSRFRSDVADLQAVANRLELFGNLQGDVDKARAAVLAARQAVVDLGQEVARSLGSGSGVSDDLTKRLAAAEKAAQGATKEFDRQSKQLDTLRGSLSKAGVNVNTLSAEQTRLAAAIRTASAAQTEQDARQVIGIKTLKDVTPEIQRVYAAYNTLASSGTLSVKEVAIAQQQLGAKVAELRGQVTTLATTSNNSGSALVGLFKTPLAHALSLAAAGALVEHAISASIAAAKEFNQGIAEIGTITSLSTGQLAALGDQARALARDLGVDINDALKGLFDLIRSGVPPDNAIAVLRIAAEASKAALTDLGAGIRVANLLLDSFGATADQLPLLFDKIIAGSKAGGATLKEFADSAGPLLNVARAAGVSFDELLATLTVLVNKSGNAEKSVADLTKIIATLDTSAAREKLRDLGIESTSLVGIFQQLGARGLSVGDVLGIQLTAAGAKSAASLAALTQNSKDLPDALDKVRGAAGTTGTALEKLLNTPAERSARFNAALHESGIQLGNFVGSGSRLQAVATSILNALNDLPKAFDQNTTANTIFDNALARSVASLFGVTPPAKAATQALTEVAAQQQATAAATAATTAALSRANQELGDFSKRLLEEVQAIQAASARDIQDVETRASAEIAALSRRRDASLDTANATIAIDTKTAAARLAIIVKAEAAITSAVEKATAAREALARRNGENETKIAGDSAAARIAALAPVLAQYQAHYAALLSQSQGFAAKIEQTDRDRVDFNRGIEQQIFEIRLSRLSVFDQYVAKANEAERLIAEARAAGVNGDIEQARKFTDQAIALAGQLATVTDKNGTVIVTNLQVQEDKQKLLKEAAAGYNEALDLQAASAKKGSDATKASIDEVVPKLEDLQKRVDALKETADAGLQYKVIVDEASVRLAQQTLDALSAPRTTTLTVEVQQVPAPGSPPLPTPAPGFALGGLVRPQHFATGGTVGKVPGTGNGDTVPAMLRAGSFVVRKAASNFYGDSLMGAVVRGYAGGGTVTKQEVQAYAANKWGFDPFSSKVFDPGNIGGRTDTGGGAPQTDPKKGFRSGDTFQDAFTQRVISLDTRPIPEALITAVNVIGYAKQMLNSVGQNNPLLGSLGDAVLAGINAVARNPHDQKAVESLLQAAETIGANPYLFAMWGKTAGSPAAAQVKPEWFLDWLQDRGFVDSSGQPQGGGTGGGLSGTPLPGSIQSRVLSPTFANDFAKRFFSQAIPAAGNPLLRLLTGGGGAPGRFRPFASGGGSSDTVPAMLTPGEFVVSKPAVDRMGVGMLHAINQMRLPPEAVRNLLSPRAPIARFATGGPVAVNAGATILPGQTAAGLPGPLSGPLTINIYSPEPINAERIRPAILKVIDEVQRRTR